MGFVVAVFHGLTISFRRGTLHSAEVIRTVSIDCTYGVDGEDVASGMLGRNLPGGCLEDVTIGEVDEAVRIVGSG